MKLSAHSEKCEKFDNLIASLRKIKKNQDQR
jgi:hypothetical protein